MGAQCTSCKASGQRIMVDTEIPDKKILKQRTQKKKQKMASKKNVIYVEKHKPNLLRPNTDTLWNADAIQALEDEITHELSIYLQQQRDYITDSEDDDNTTNLFRDESCDKWDDIQVEDTYSEMAKQLSHLQKYNTNDLPQLTNK